MAFDCNPHIIFVTFFAVELSQMFAQLLPRHLVNATPTTILDVSFSFLLSR